MSERAWAKKVAAMTDEYVRFLRGGVPCQCGRRLRVPPPADPGAPRPAGGAGAGAVIVIDDSDDDTDDGAAAGSKGKGKGKASSSSSSAAAGGGGGGKQTVLDLTESDDEADRCVTGDDNRTAPAAAGQGRVRG
jgi:hypothetical protein